MDHTIFMREALAEAKKAQSRDEVPIGAVLVERASGKIVARASNSTREHCDPTSHAEILLIRDQCKTNGAQRIPGYDLYVTLEPCPMCAAAISFARIDRVIFGAADPKSGGLLTGPALYTHSQLHHKPEVVSGINETACSKILQDYFREKRINNKNL